MAETNENVGRIITDALADPRFAQIFAMLKSKADNGELDVSRALSSVVSDKEQRAEPSLDNNGLGTDPPAVQDSKDEPSADGTPRTPDMMELLTPLISDVGSGKGGSMDLAKHEKLLYALKPYLSDGKKNAVDSILKAAKVGGVLETLLGTKGSGK